LTAGLIAPRTRAQGRVTCREDAILCGTAWFNETYRQLDTSLEIRWHARDGDPVATGMLLCELDGTARAVLTGERTALNFLQLLSGTATITRRYVSAIEGTGCRILDTRKTLPGLRSAQKYAVRCGGGSNHRMGLYDLILIKENHIAAAGSIAAAVGSARAQSPGVRIEVETETLEQVQEALAVSADIILLDNCSLEQMRAAVGINRAHAHPAQLESSGGVSLETVRDIADTGVDYISVGALTKHVTALDLSMRIASVSA
jgi:nicotinate-nucleotide pyrophosphorylase (carboxylating)